MAQFYNPKPADISDRLDDVRNENVPAVNPRRSGYFRGMKYVAAAGAFVLGFAVYGTVLKLRGPELPQIIQAIERQSPLIGIDEDYKKMIIEMYTNPEAVYQRLAPHEKERIDEFDINQLSKEKKGKLKELYPWVNIKSPSLADKMVIDWDQTMEIFLQRYR